MNFSRLAPAEELAPTPKAFANSSPGLERSDNPGEADSRRDPTLKGLNHPRH